MISIKITSKESTNFLKRDVIDILSQRSCSELRNNFIEVDVATFEEHFTLSIKNTSKKFSTFLNMCVKEKWRSHDVCWC